MQYIDSIKSLATHSGPCVSLYMPTHKFGDETLSDSSHFNSLLNSAENKLGEQNCGAADVEIVMNKIRTHTSPSEYWQHQDVGLAVFASTDLFMDFSLPFTVQEMVVSDDYFHLRQLLPLFHESAKFFVLHLTKNDVSLYRADGHVLHRIQDPDIPSSMEEALAHEDLERELQVRSVGHSNAAFHGHGAGDDIDKAVLERYLRAVDRGISGALRDEKAPLVLACVPYYLPIFKSVSRYGHIHPTSITGSSERFNPEELYCAAWDTLKPIFLEDERRSQEKLEQMNGTGLTVTGLPEILEHAQAGRVDTLFVTSTQQSTTTTEDELNWVINATITQGGNVIPRNNSATEDSPTIALLRY